MNYVKQKPFGALALLLGVLSLPAGCGFWVDDADRLERAEEAILEGDLRAAIIDLKAVAQSQPDNPEVRVFLADTALAIGDAATAEKEFEVAIELGTSLDTIRTNFAQAKLANAKPAEALEIADPKAAATDADRYETWMIRGAALAQLGRTSDAVNSFAAADELAIDPVIPLIEIAKLQSATGDLDGAEATLAEALTRSADSASATYELAVVLVKKGEPEQAEEHIEARLNDDALIPEQDRIAFQALLFDINVLQDDIDEARVVVDNLKQQNPEYGQLTGLMEGRLALASGNFEEVIDICGDLIAQYPGNLAAHMMLADAHMNLGQIGMAEAYVQTVLDAQPDNPQARDFLTALRTGQTQTAVIAASRTPSTNNTATLRDVSSTTLTEQDPAFTDAALAAETEIPSLLETVPETDQQRREDLILRYQESGRDDPRILVDLEAWLQDFPEDGLVRAILAQEMLDMGQFTAAREHYEAFLAQSPDVPAALNNLAWVYHELDDPRAVEMARRAVELLPHEPSVLDTLGWILAHNGQAEEAVSLLNEAYESSQQRPEIGHHLAYALAASGRLDAARVLVDALLNDDSLSAELRSTITALASTLN